MGARVYLCSHQKTTKTHYRGDRRVSEKVKFSKICRCQQVSNSRAFGGPMARGSSGHYMGPHGCLSTYIVTK